MQASTVRWDHKNAALTSILMGIKGAFLTHQLCIEGQQFWDLICLDEQRPLDWESVSKSRWVSVVDGVVIIETEHELWSAPPVSLMVNYTIPKCIALGFWKFLKKVFKRNWPRVPYLAFPHWTLIFLAYLKPYNWHFIKFSCPFLP